MEKEFVKVKIGRLEGDGPNYEVMALPEGADFRDRESYERFTACWLKINGYGFAAAGFEISEHDETVTLKQDCEGGSMHLEI